jgi:predicted RNase H-like nuclease
MVQLETEGFLIQLGYPANEANKEKLHKVIENTKGFEHLEKHVIQLNDALKSLRAYITLSNNKNLLKIKKDTISDEIAKSVDEIVQSWAQKYKVQLIYQPQNSSYYINGKTH